MEACPYVPFRGDVAYDTLVPHWAHHWANWSLLQGEPVATLEPSEYSKYLVCQNDCGAHPLVRTKVRNFGGCLVVTSSLATSGCLCPFGNHSSFMFAPFRWLMSIPSTLGSGADSHTIAWL